MAAKSISASQLIERIATRLQSAGDNRPCCTLIMGSGCSVPLIPTTRQIVHDDLPWWLMCRAKDVSSPSLKDFEQDRADGFKPQRESFAKEFWKRAVASSELGRAITLGDDGLPVKDCIAEAYKFVLSADCGCGLSTPDEVRRYFAAMVARIGNRLNPAHLLLASLVAEQPRLFGTIFTTNFDPLLQRAMQLMNVPYFVSDQPGSMQHPDDDDAVAALHLVHAHGSIYRYLLLNSPDQISEYAQRNQALLPEYFRKHLVLIVGYGGWDDAITRALENVAQFDHNLYWCDRGSTVASSGLSNIATRVLAKHSNAFYVPIEDADLLMLELHQAVTGHTLPRLFREPITVLNDQLQRCDLSSMKLSRAEGSKAADDVCSSGAEKEDGAGEDRSTDSTDLRARGAPASGSGFEPLDLGGQVKDILRRLERADRLFKGVTDEAGAETARLRAQVDQRITLASDLYFSNRYADALPHFDFVISNEHVLDVSERARAHFFRGYACGQRGEAGDWERAIADYTAVIDMPEAPAEQWALARVNRGITYSKRGEAGDVELEIADYTAVIETPIAPTEQQAKARLYRGITYRQRGEAGDLELRIADYTAVIEMPDATAEQRAIAHLNRGFAYGERGGVGDIEREIADYTAVIEMPEAPAEQRAKAGVNRGLTYWERGDAGDKERAIADYTAVIEMPEAPAEQRAKARVNRGHSYGQRGEAGDLARAIADNTAVLEMVSVPSPFKRVAQRRLDELKQRS
ncbi:MAG: SIR2 family protein [Pirellulales bacterium]|nr:SIR2 family protein [Pirellulales bacterium]